MLAIDTSSARSALALLDAERVLAEVVKPSGREFDVAAEAGRLVQDLSRLDSVLVALGPGSFTGLRQGIAFGVGLALGLGIPLRGIGTLDLVAARSEEPVVALSEAGRGRVYFQAPDGSRGIAGYADVPRGWPAAGWLRTGAIEVLPDSRLRTFGEAVLTVGRMAREVGYGTVKPEYMQQLGRLT
jgi:tRNA threonylcarbamoyladenosine biosynthesis protein TsaB